MGDGDIQRKFLVVNGNDITWLKHIGGLGIRRLEVVNSLCLMKLGWEVRNGSEVLWCMVLKENYGRNSGDPNHAGVKPDDSRLWRNISSVLLVMAKTIRPEMGV